MKGVRVFYDETNKKRFVQVDIDVLIKQRNQLQEYFDVLLMNSRQNESSVSLGAFERRLRKASKK